MEEMDPIRRAERAVTALREKIVSKREREGLPVYHVRTRNVRYTEDIPTFTYCFSDSPGPSGQLER